MSIDLTKLTPAPWTYYPDASVPSIRAVNGIDVFWEDADRPGLQAQHGDDLPFIALARNAFDVLDRRHVVVFNAVAFMLGGVLKTHEQRREFSHWLLAQNFTDIFTALVEADKWLTEREKGCGERLA